MPDAESPAPLLQIPLADLAPRRSVRADPADDGIEALAESIRDAGILTPLIIAPLPDGRWAVISGERRRRAAIRAGLETVPAIPLAGRAAEIHPVDLCLADNQHRLPLNPIDLAEALDARRRDGVPDRELARSIGRSPSALSNLLRLLQLPDEARAHVREGRLSETQARAILAAPAEFRRDLADAAVADDFSVRDIQAAAHDLIDRAGPPPRRLAQRAQRAVAAFAETIGIEHYRVNGPRGLAGGSITIYFSNPDELDQITSRIAQSTGRPAPINTPVDDFADAETPSGAAVETTETADPIAPPAEADIEEPEEDTGEDLEEDLEENPESPQRPPILHDDGPETESYLRAAGDDFPEELIPPAGWAIHLAFRFGSTEIWWQPGPDAQDQGAEPQMVGLGPPKLIYPGTGYDPGPLPIPPGYFSRENFGIAPPEARPPPIA